MKFYFPKKAKSNQSKYCMYGDKFGDKEARSPEDANVWFICYFCIYFKFEPNST